MLCVRPERRHGAVYEIVVRPTERLRNLLSQFQLTLRGHENVEEKPVDARVQTAEVVNETASAVSWGSIAAGGFAAAALSLALLALGVGLGLASVSPWGGSGVSASTFNNISGAYLVIMAIMSSAVGGYLAARLRTRWTGLHTNEVFFRDTAHGFIAWAFATVLSVSVLAGAATHIAAGAASGLGAAAGTRAVQTTGPYQVYVDKLFRADAAATPANSSAGGATPPSAATSNEVSRAEVNRLFTTTFSGNADLTGADRTYVARVIAAQTGISQQEAERRVTEVVNEVKTAVDKARREAAKFAFWMTAALFFGAFAASLAAVEGGQLRDGTWSDRRLVKRAWA
jgi:hypothetical protein